MTARDDVPAGIEVLYLSSVPSPEQFRWMKSVRVPGVQEVTYGMPEAGFKFHSLIQQGLLDNGAHITSIVGRSATPAFYRGGWWRRVVERQGDQLVVDHRGFPNRRGLKQAWLALSLARAARQWRRRTRGAAHRVLVADAAYVSALPGVLLALRGAGVPRVAIVADVYRYMADVGEASSRSSRVFRLVRRIVARTFREVDGFVLLTEQMDRVVNPAGRPHLVMEGLVDHRMAEASNTPEGKDPLPTVLYAGALRREYGLASLVDGFRAVSSPDARLVVYGAGDYAPDVVRAAAQDPRIEFRGSAPTEEVVRAEERAWLLVNPRPAEEEFTQYSFPSKNMEYLASGTPVLTTRLPGMPQEYYEHVLTIDGPEVADVTKALEQALALSPAELHERGRRGKQFVLDHKNDREQGRRLLTFATECL